MACEEAHGDVVNILLAAGADVHAQDVVGFTPLLFAAKKAPLPILAALKSMGSAMDHCTQVAQYIRAPPRKGSNKFAKVQASTQPPKIDYRRGYDAVDLVQGNPHAKSRGFVKRELRKAHLLKIQRVLSLLYLVKVCVCVCV